MEHKSRTPGSGFERLDDALVNDMRDLVNRRQAATPWAAAQAVADRAAGGGTLDSKARRLAKRYSEKFIKLHGGDPAESDSTSGMNGTTQSPDAIATLQLRIAGLQADLAQRDRTIERAQMMIGKLLDAVARFQTNFEPRLAELERLDALSHRDPPPSEVRH